MKIFISYRRADTAALAGRLADALARVPGVQAVFHDVDTIPLGRDFAEVIEERLADASHVFILIGPAWATIRGADGGLRLHADDDLVRHEVAQALRRPGCLAVPVLVDDAAMPRVEDLPADLAALPRANAFTLRNSKFHADLAELLERLLGHVPRATALTPLGIALRLVAGAVGGLVLFLCFSAVIQYGLQLRVAELMGLPDDEEKASLLWMMLGTLVVMAGALLPFLRRFTRPRPSAPPPPQR